MAVPTATTDLPFPRMGALLCPPCIHPEGAIGPAPLMIGLILPLVPLLLGEVTMAVTRLFLFLDFFLKLSCDFALSDNCSVMPIHDCIL